MEKEHSNPVSGLMGETMDKIREMVDVNTVVGDPIQAGGVTILPISKVSVGFASGGTDLDLKKQEKSGNTAFGGAGGASVKVTPVAFLVVKEDNVRLLPLALPAAGAADRLVELLPDVLDRVNEFLDRRRTGDADGPEPAGERGEA